MTGAERVAQALAEVDPRAPRLAASLVAYRSRLPYAERTRLTAYLVAYRERFGRYPVAVPAYRFRGERA